MHIFVPINVIIYIASCSYSTTTLKFLFPIVITSPSNATLPVGDVAVFDCVGTSTTTNDFTIQWFKNEGLVNGSLDTRILISQTYSSNTINSTLSISDLQLSDDASSYSCTLSAIEDALVESSAKAFLSILRKRNHSCHC